MRLSTDEHDPGYEAWGHLLAQDKHITVYLDGLALEDVITADDEQGIVVRYNRGADAQFVLVGDPADPHIARETLTGRVIIEWSDRPAR